MVIGCGRLWGLTGTGGGILVGTGIPFMAGLRFVGGSGVTITAGGDAGALGFFPVATGGGMSSVGTEPPFLTVRSMPSRVWEVREQREG